MEDEDKHDAGQKSDQRADSDDRLSTFFENIRLTGYEPAAAPLVATVYAFAQLYLAYEIAKRKAGVDDQLEEVNDRLDDIQQSLQDIELKIDFLIAEIQKLVHELKGHITKTMLRDANGAAMGRIRILRDIVKNPVVLKDELDRAQRNLDELEVTIGRIEVHTKGGISRLLAVSGPYATFAQMHMIVQLEKERQKFTPTWIWDKTIHLEMVKFVNDIFDTHEKTMKEIENEEKDQLFVPRYNDRKYWEFKSGLFTETRTPIEGTFRFDPLWQPLRDPYQSVQRIALGQPRWKTIVAGEKNNYSDFPDPSLIDGAMRRADYVIERTDLIREYRRVTAQFEDFKREFGKHSAKDPEFY